MVLVRERLGAAPSEDAIELIFGPRLEEGLKDFDHMLRVHKAHAIMLARQNIITEEVASKLLTVLKQLQDDGLESMELDPKLEDLFYNIENVITLQAGARVAGQLHTGRSRNDLKATILRLHVRDHVLDLCATAINLRSAVLDLAERHVKTVMPGYTHLKPSQPISFGYYLSAVANALERDTARLARSFETANRNPLGAAAMAGTSFPLDRELTTSLLGFDSLAENALDAIASNDHVLELISAAAILATTLSRLTTDLYIWQSDEFSMIELADDISGTSSIMPQKKNPHPLEQAKGRASQVYGALIASLAGSKGAIFSNNGESGGAGVQQLEMAVRETVLCMRLVTMVMQNVSVNASLMHERTTRDFSTVTELADMLVRKYGISFREAHGVVGGTVKRAVAQGIVATDITAEMLNEECVIVLGNELPLDASEIAESLDPMSSLTGKVSKGSPNPDEVERMISEAVERLKDEVSVLNERIKQRDDAYSRLEQEATRFIDRPA